MKKFLGCIDLRNGIITIGIITCLTSLGTIISSALMLFSLSGTGIICGIILAALAVLDFGAALILFNGVCRVNYNNCEYLQELRMTHVFILLQYEDSRLKIYLIIKALLIILLVVGMIMAFITKMWMGVYCLIQLGLISLRILIFVFFTTLLVFVFQCVQFTFLCALIHITSS